MTAQETIRAALRRAAERLGAPVPDVALERPREAEHGDVATNVALVLAKTLQAKPRAVAEQLVAALELPPGIVKKTEIAGPGLSHRMAHVGRNDAPTGSRGQLRLTDLAQPQRSPCA